MFPTTKATATDGVSAETPAERTASLDTESVIRLSRARAGKRTGTPEAGTATNPAAVAPTVSARLPGAGGLASSWTPAATASVTALPVQRDAAGRAPTGMGAPSPGDGVPLAVTGAWDDLEETLTPLEDFVALARWRNEDIAVSTSRRGKKRSGKTRLGAESELAFAADYFRYGPGDPRLEAADRLAGASLRFDHPAGITEADCIAFIEHRRNTNLSTRAANESALRA